MRNLILLHPNQYALVKAIVEKEDAERNRKNEIAQRLGFKDAFDVATRVMLCPSLPNTNWVNRNKRYMQNVMTPRTERYWRRKNLIFTIFIKPFRVLKRRLF